MIRVWFFGTPFLSRQVLEDIYNSSIFEVVFVVTWADKKVWRDQKIVFSPVKDFALEKWIQLFQPEKITRNEEFLWELQKIDVDYYVVVAYGKILPEIVLNMPKKLCLNVHWSILPKLRWASPIQSSLLNWDSVTWVTIMKMSAWMDEWDILDKIEIKIDKFETSETLFNKFWLVSGKFLVDTIVRYEKWEIELKPQDSNLATYCKKINKEDWKLDFDESADTIFYKWKWYTPWPWIYTFLDDKKLTITSCDYILEDAEWNIWEVIKWDFWIGVKCGKWVLALKEVKLEGKWNMRIEDFVNGRRDFVGRVL